MLTLCLALLHSHTALAAPWILRTDVSDVPLFSDEIASIERAAKTLARREAPMSQRADLSLRYECVHAPSPGRVPLPECEDAWRVILSVEKIDDQNTALVFSHVERPEDPRAWRDTLAKTTIFPAVTAHLGYASSTERPPGWSIKSDHVFHADGRETWHRPSSTSPATTSHPNHAHHEHHEHHDDTQAWIPSDDERAVREASLQSCKAMVRLDPTAQFTVLIDVSRRGAITECEVQKSSLPSSDCACEAARTWSMPPDAPHRRLIAVTYRAPGLDTTSR
jgi:hypothetical protein